MIPLAVLALTTARAQTPLALQQAIERADRQRPELSAGAARTAAAQQQRRQAALAPSPRLSLQAENLGGDLRFSQDADTLALVGQTVEVSGRRGARIGLADAAVSRSRIEQELTRREILFRVRQAYWETLGAQYMRDLYLQDASYFQQVVDYHQARLQEGKVAEVDVLRVQLEGERLRSAAEDATLEYNRAQTLLARELGDAPATRYELTEDFEQLETPRRGDSTASFITARPEYRLAEEAVGAARARVALEKAFGRPDLDFVGGYKRTSGLNTAVAGLQLDLPLWNRNQGAVAAAEREVSAAGRLLEATQLQLETEYAAAQRQYEIRREQILMRYRPIRDRALEIAEIGRAAYREGGTDLLRLLDSERLRTETQLAYVRMLHSYHQSVVEVERAGGMEP